MIRRVFAAGAALWLLTSAPSASQAPASSADNLVVLDISVTDKNGVVTDLKQEDFEIQDDGKKVEIKSFNSVLASGTTAAGDSRDLVLILDDAGVPNNGTQAIQQIASMFVSGARPGDAVSVVRLHTTADEVVRDRQIALARIAAYQAGSIPFFNGETTEDLLRLVSKTSKHWANTNPYRRKAIVCIGSAAVCVPEERDPTAPRDMYPNWVDVIGQTALGNVVVYAAVPDPRAKLSGGSLVERSGGELFSGLSNFVAAAERVYRDLSHYYLIAYAPQSSKKDMRSIYIKVNRKGITINARNKRGK